MRERHRSTADRIVGGAVSDDELRDLLIEHGETDTVEDVRDAYLDHWSWQHDHGLHEATFEEWLPASGWLS